jgi:L-rhamnose mutarotase
MKTVAFKMKLKPGFAEEYQKRHDAIWPELVLLLQNAGISDYSIFFDEETNDLFAVQKLDGASTSQGLASDPIVQKWWSFMSDIMECHPDLSPVTKPLKQVFYMP